MLLQQYCVFIGWLLLRISALEWAEQIMSDQSILQVNGNANQDPIPVATTTNDSTENSSNNDTCENPQVGSVVDDPENNAETRELVRGDSDKDDDDEDDDEDEEDDYRGFPFDYNEWGKPQVVRDDAVEKRLVMSRKYMFEIVFASSWEGKYWCRNEHVACSLWASEGTCEQDHDFMVANCSPACQTCEEFFEKYYDADADDDDDDDDDADVQLGEPTSTVPSVWGVPQNVYATIAEEAYQSIVNATLKYMTETVLPNPEIYSEVYRECQNKFAQCTAWAARGDCDTSPGHMHVYCAPACQTCDQLDYSKRCPVPPAGTEAFQKPGDLHAMFQRIVADPFWEENYGPVEVLSSPDSTGGPWIITLEKFLTDEECTRFIELGAEAGYKRSEDVAEEDTFYGSMDSVESEGRTSTNAWCMDPCNDDPIAEPVHRRVEKLTGMHYNYSEYYQLLRYEPGQFYEEHHDYITTEWNRPQGPRVLTVFMYLNDVEDGGGTHFGPLNLTVQPKKGKAVIWPSVLDEDPLEWDERTHHEALVVNAGIKYGANAWFHLRDFKTQSEKGCI